MVQTSLSTNPQTASSPDKLTTNQLRGFWAAWGGWALDGMDSFIYALVMVPALRDLLPRSGIPATAPSEGFYGGLLFALFLVGWGLAMLWGPVADRFGRVRTLMLTIAWYSLFTFLGAFARDIWQLAAFRLLAGIGIGGEWAMGGTFIAEEWPEHRRAMGAGWMHTGYYFGFFLAALLNYIVGTHYGWRAMFAVGGVPAILVGLIRYGVAEPRRWQEKLPKTSMRTLTAPFLMLFSPAYRRRTILNCVYVLVSIIGLWAGAVYVPTSVMQLAAREGMPASAGARLASYGSMLLAVGTILGCIVLPPLANRLGRRAALGLYFAVMLVFIPLAFGYVFYAARHSLGAFIACLPFLGFGGANFAMYTLWLPEQYPTECRASAFALCVSAGRFVGAGITFLVGAGVTYFHSIGIPVALTAIAFAVGLALLVFGEETRGQPLPA